MTNPIEDLLPTDPLMAVAWYACLRAMLKHDAAFEAFRRDTGNTWEPGATPLERMIDEATGADADFLRKFVVWFNENIWGDLDLEAGNP